jgi:hypothetical protein
MSKPIYSGIPYDFHLTKSGINDNSFCLFKTSYSKKIQSANNKHFKLKPYFMLLILAVGRNGFLL